MGRERRRSTADRGEPGPGEAAFRRHLAFFLVGAIFFLGLNLLTNPGEWWFQWPVFVWGFAVVFHAVALFGAAAPARVAEVIRTMRRGGTSAPPSPSVPPKGGAVQRGSAGAAGSAAAIEEAEARVARLWRTARRIPSPSAREQAFKVCAAADRVAEVMAQDRTEPETVRWFIDRLLAPTETLVERYARLAGRNLPAAAPTLDKVEREDLPRIEARLDALYQQLHRGDVVDLAVASEMLEFGLDDAPPLAVRGRGSGVGGRKSD